MIIVGGGIAGLSAAYDLKRAGHDVTVIEAAPRFGGKIGTLREDGCLIEQGPDSIFCTKPWALDLITELGLGDDLIEPQTSEFSILVKGRLHGVPRALATMMPTAATALEKVGFLSAAAKKRFLKEKEVAKGESSDESIASFFRRRFGRHFSEMVAEPMLAGIHAGDPEKLSMNALYPGYMGMEREHGSLGEAMTNMKRPPSEPGRKVGFVSLRQGMESLTRRLVEELEGAKLMSGAKVAGIGRDGQLLKVTIESGETLVADDLILAVPAFVASALLAELAPKASRKLGEIQFVSTAVATLAYSRAAFPHGLHGNGFLVPFNEACEITGCTWSSNKWAERAPDDALLMRCFMGRVGGLVVDDHSDAELIAKAVDGVSSVLQPITDPSYQRLDRWPRAMAQYELGHLDLLAEAEAGLDGLPIQLIGSSYRGNSISDCVRQGRDAAQMLEAMPV